MKNIFPLITFITTATLTAQTPQLEGVYRPNGTEAEFQIRLNANNTADALMATGTFTVTNNLVELKFNQGSMFGVSKKQGESTRLEITFVPEGHSDFSPRFIYIGYETADGQIHYESMYNKVQDEEDLTIEIPRTENLYLVNAYKAAVLADPKAAVEIEKFNIGKQTNALEVTVDLTKAVTGELSLLYNPDKQTLTLHDQNLSYDPITFTKITNLAENFLQPVNLEKVKNWKHLIAFHEEEDIPQYNPNAPADQVLKKVKSFAEAQALAGKNNTLIALFYQPKNAKAQEEFDKLFEWYEDNGADYSADAHKSIYRYQPYLATATDAKWLKKRNISAENQLLIFSPEGELVYTELNTPAEVLKNETFSYQQAFLLNTSVVAKFIDRVLGKPKAPIAEVEKVFGAITGTFYSSELFLLAANRPKKADADDEKEVSGLIADHLKQYNHYLKNIESVYRFKLTDKELLAQWERLVAAHEKDSKLSTAFAAIAAFNTGSPNIYERCFYNENESTETDLKAAVYLLRFFKEIKAYNDGLPDSDLGELAHGSINVLPTNIENLFKKLVTADADHYLLRVKEAYAVGVNSGFFSPISYIEFLYDNDLTYDAAEAFGSYYRSLMAKDTHLIAALDRAFSEKDDDYSWKFYKMRFANRANNIAWKVYEDLKDNMAMLKEAYAWAQSAVQLEPENPYYLDTLAHLMYANGDKQQAISTEEKAVELLSTTEDGRDEEREQVKANLQKMKSGNL